MPFTKGKNNETMFQPTVAKISDMGNKVVQPQGSEAEALNEKNQGIDAYKQAVENTLNPEDVEANERYMQAVSEPSEADKVNPESKFGSKPGEERIDTSSMLGVLGQK